MNRQLQDRVVVVQLWISVDSAAVREPKSQVVEKQLVFRDQAVHR